VTTSTVMSPDRIALVTGATSGIGKAVVETFIERGLKVICVVRDVAKWEAPLKTAGAACVVADDDDYPKQLKALTGGAKPKLALNSVGGESVSRLIKCTADGGTVVTFGGMVGDKVRFPTRYLIFNDVSLVGFWMDRWLRTSSPEEVQALYEAVFGLLRDGTFEAPVAATYPLSGYKEAIGHATGGGRDGKVLLSGDE